MKPVRRLMEKLTLISLPPPQHGSAGRLKTNSSTRSVITEPAVNVESLLRSDPVSQEDINNALLSTKRSSDGNMERLC